jgi:hypothetical protein
MSRIESRLNELEKPGRAGADEKKTAPEEPASRGRFLPPWHVNGAGYPRQQTGAAGAQDERALIAVPNLTAAPSNLRDASVSGLTQRYAAIWTLADQGASPEVIARATGQPIGQIELILGLRRQIDGTRTTISHAPQV